jgi:hypothetical protein
MLHNHNKYTTKGVNIIHPKPVSLKKANFSGQNCEKFLLPYRALFFNDAASVLKA